MNPKRNRRTLKKRIKHAMSFSTLFTVTFLGGIMIFLVIVASRGIASYQAEVVSYKIQNDINSGVALKILGIRNIEDIEKNTDKVDKWLGSLSKESIIDQFISFTSEEGNKVFVTIAVKNRVLYSNEAVDPEGTSKIYRDTEAAMPIYDSNGNTIGSVSARMNPQFLLGIVVPILTIIVFLSLVAYVFTKILGIFLVIPVINPLKQLETKFKAIADGDQETAASTEIMLKKPLREIESLVDSTNEIMKKLKSYNELLEKQKVVLENQNDELELQNEELIESKNQIQKQQAQLVQSEKMASVGLLTAAITHEINTPIGAINSNAQLQQMLLDVLVSHPVIQSDEELSTMFTQMKEANDVNLMACCRIIEIIKSLKTFSRLDQADFQEANINEGIKSVLVLTNNLLKRRITVHEDYGDLPPVKCFPGQLNQVFMNLIVNASQAIENEGELFIKTFEKSSYIYITISDTGSGIKDEDLTKIFDPGFTTKGVGVGLGLGLYISYNIIQAHNGEITVQSKLCQGTEFTIKIPIDNDKT